VPALFRSGFLCRQGFWSRFLRAWRGISQLFPRSAQRARSIVRSAALPLLGMVCVDLLPLHVGPYCLPLMFPPHPQIRVFPHLADLGHGSFATGHHGLATFQPATVRHGFHADGEHLRPDLQGWRWSRHVRRAFGGADVGAVSARYSPITMTPSSGCGPDLPLGSDSSMTARSRSSSSAGQSFGHRLTRRLLVFFRDGAALHKGPKRPLNTRSPRPYPRPNSSCHPAGSRASASGSAGPKGRYSGIQGS